MALRAAEHDLCGPLLDLVTAVLAIGKALLSHSGGPTERRQSLLGLSQLSHRLAGRYRTRPSLLDIWRTPACGHGFWRAGRTCGIDLRV